MDEVVLSKVENVALILDTINEFNRSVNLDALRDKKTNTWGSREYEGPCPRCKRLGLSNGGENRLFVHPYRPAWGHGSKQEPVFTCRQCTDPEDSRKPWSGDLVGFVREMKGLSYAAALAYLGLGDAAKNGYVAAPVRPMPSATGAPSEQYQQKAIAFVVESMERLWSEEGAAYLRYLKQRGFVEETIRKYKLGCVVETHYDLAGDWFVEGQEKLLVPRGIVIPELHIINSEGVEYREVWSVNIRCADSDKDIVKDWHKYHLLGGGERGLYNADAVCSDLPIVLVEGQLDALTIQQEGRGDFVGVATQSASGARKQQWLERILIAPLIMLAFDPDEAGKGADAWWREILSQDVPHISCSPTQGDFNKVLVEGGDVYAHLCLYRDALIPLLLSPQSMPDAETTVTLVDVPLEVSDGLTVISEPNRGIEPETKDRLCEKCQGQGRYEYEGKWWCEPHYMCVSLLEKGEKIDWMPFSEVRGGKGGYFAFIRESSPELIREAMEEAHYIGAVGKARYLQEQKEGQAKEYNKRFCCARAPGGCTRRYDKPYQPFHGQKRNEMGKWVDIAHPIWTQQVITVGEETLRFCGACTSSYNLLKMGEMMGHPEFTCGKLTLEATPESWVLAATHASDFESVMLFDALRMCYGKAWDMVMESTA